MNEKPRPTLTAQGLGAFLFAWAALFGAVSSCIVIFAFDPDTRGWRWMASFTVGLALQGAAGVGFLSGYRRATAVLYSATTIQLFLIGISVWWGTKVYMPFVAPVVIGMLVVTRSSSFDANPVAELRRALHVRTRHVVIVVLFLAASLGVLLLRKDIRRLLWDLKMDRWASICESSHSPDACGQWALNLVRDGADYDHMRKGLELFDDLCARKIHKGCELGGKLRYRRGFRWLLGETGAPIRIAAKRCQQGDGRGCLIAAQYSGKPSPALLAPAKAACEHKDDPSCLAMYSLGQKSEACKAGFRSTCQPSAVESGTCLDGAFVSCRSESNPVLRAMADLRPPKMNPALYQESLKVDGLDDKCAADDAAACFVLGLNATADINPMDFGPAPLRSMELTFGKACELGANVACYVFALRLLDRNFTETKREEARARELLQTACDRGHAGSCRLMARELYVLPDDLDAFREAAHDDCKKVGECAEWTEVLAYDIGADPWLVVDVDGYHHLRYGCRHANDLKSCEAAARQVLTQGQGGAMTVPELYVQGASMARKSCQSHWIPSCRLLFEYAQTMQEYGMSSPAKLREEICAQEPAACDDE